MIKLLALLTLLAAPLSVLSQDHPVAFTNVTVIDMRGDQPKPNMTVIVSGDRIAAIGRKLKVPKNAQTIDASGKFLMPGLWDNYTYALEAVKNGLPFLELLVAHGVTTVTDVGTSMDLREASKLREEIEGGRILGPRVFYAGRIANGTDLSATWKDLSQSHNDADEARQFVDALARAGVDYIQIGPSFPPDLVPGVTAAAKEHKLPVQQYTVYGYADASNAGVNCIEHFADLYRTTSAKRDEYFAFNRERRGRTMTPDEVYRFFATLRAAPDKKYFAETIRTLARNKTCVTTNFAEQAESKAVFEFADPSRRRFKTQSQLAELDAAIADKERQKSKGDFRTTDVAWKGLLGDVSDLHRAGVPIVAGTQSDHDGVTSPGIWLHDELYWLVQAGLSPFEALKAATINPARFMRRDRDLGTIEKGKLADMVLLDANPLIDISNTRRINAVVVNGRYLSRDAIDKLLLKVETWAKGH